MSHAGGDTAVSSSGIERNRFMPTPSPKRLALAGLFLAAPWGAVAQTPGVNPGLTQATHLFKHGPKTFDLCPPPVSRPAPAPAECEPAPADCPLPEKACTIHKSLHRPRIIVEQSAPEVVFQSAPVQSVRAPGGCTKPGCGFLQQSAPVPEYQSQPYFVPQSAPAQTFYTTQAAPVTVMQMQSVPVTTMQYQMVPVQQSAFVQQSAPVMMAQSAPAPLQQQSAIATAIGTELGIRLIERIIRERVSAPRQVCPEEAFQEMARQLKAINDAAGARAAAGPGPASADEAATVQDALKQIRDAKALLEAKTALTEEVRKLKEQLQMQQGK